MNVIDRPLIKIEDEFGPFYLTHGVRGSQKISVEGRRWMICRCCIRDRLRDKQTQMVNCIALIAIVEPILAEIAVMRFEMGWSTKKIGKHYNVPYRVIKDLEKKVIQKIREGVCDRHVKK